MNDVENFGIIHRDESFSVSRNTLTQIESLEGAE